jgi:hypothetical protein
MLRPAGLEPIIMRETPQALSSEAAYRAATLQGVQQASGVRVTRWASTREIQRVLELRGEPSAAAVAVGLLPQLLREGVLEQQTRRDGLYWRRVL